MSAGNSENRAPAGDELDDAALEAVTGGNWLEDKARELAAARDAAMLALGGAIVKGASAIIEVIAD